MKAHRLLDWETSESDGGTVHAGTGDYFIYQYRIGARTTWRLEGHGLDILNADIEVLKRRAQDDDNRRRQLKAWEDYMLANDPPSVLGG